MARLTTLVVPFLLIASACSANADDPTGGAESADTSAKPHLLAIGDSITFAWDPHVESDIHKVDARKYSGYAELLGKELGMVVDNGACPGETSGALIDAKQEDNGCRNNRATYAMHYPWGEPTQIDFVRDYVGKRAPNLVTMTIGGNDLLVMQKHCKGIPAPVDGLCKLARLPFYVHAYGEHIQSIIQDLDATGYKGTFVVTSTYAPDYSDHLATLALTQMNGEMKEHVEKASANLHGMTVRIADGYGAFEAVAKQHGGKTCDTGLLIKKDDGTCDIHPTAAGHRVLADAVKKAIGR